MMLFGGGRYPLYAALGILDVIAPPPTPKKKQKLGSCLLHNYYEIWYFFQSFTSILSYMKSEQEVRVLSRNKKWVRQTLPLLVIKTHKRCGKKCSAIIEPAQLRVSWHLMISVLNMLFLLLLLAPTVSNVCFMPCHESICTHFYCIPFYIFVYLSILIIVGIWWHRCWHVWYCESNKFVFFKMVTSLQFTKRSVGMFSDFGRYWD